MTGHTPWSEIKHKSDTKELVERVRDGINSYRRPAVDYAEHVHALAALSELEERLEAAERELALEKSQADTEEMHTAGLRRRAEAAERERDAAQAAVRLEHQSRIEHQTRVAELEEALRPKVNMSWRRRWRRWFRRLKLPTPARN